MVGRVGGVTVRLVRLGVELVEADEGRVAAVGGVARVDDVDVGDEDVFEGAGRPAFGNAMGFGVSDCLFWDAVESEGMAWDAGKDVRLPEHD